MVLQLSICNGVIQTNNHLLIQQYLLIYLISQTSYGTSNAFFSAICRCICSDEFDTISSQDFNLWSTYIGNNTLNQLLVYAATNQIDFFEGAMDTLLNDMKIDNNNMINDNYHWSKIIDMSFPYVLIGSAYGIMKRVNKVSFILPYLIDVNDKYLQYAKHKDDFDERYFFGNYKMISEAAAWADMEPEVPEQFKMEFFDIQFEYQDKMDMLTGKDFSFKEQFKEPLFSGSFTLSMKVTDFNFGWFTISSTKVNTTRKDIDYGSSKRFIWQQF